ncbi:hypothetical protein [Natrinema halophilum]|uniref:Uncharacterized protein n=1 Tax=Natrinema halophilum TaxID=1699371 RepID=A0A7D5GP49_9EURY|nr:hypothetical protein [Natrinema halophilum]QLG50033.1 hypothetical protein HYG82_14795 [Natrinema halophilum]
MSLAKSVHGCRRGTGPADAGLAHLDAGLAPADAGLTPQKGHEPDSGGDGGTSACFESLFRLNANSVLFEAELEVIGGPVGIILSASVTISFAEATDIDVTWLFGGCYWIDTFPVT